MYVARSLLSENCVKQWIVQLYAGLIRFQIESRTCPGLNLKPYQYFCATVLVCRNQNR